MRSNDILNDTQKIKTYSNESADWFAISRDGTHMITFREENRFYKTQKSWAIRVAQLIRRGY